MKTILVFINGRAGVGKDTFVDFCRDYAEETHQCRVYNIHRSDAPKVALQALGWSGEKNESARSLLKHMVDFMEENGLLNRYLEEQISVARSINTNDVIIFYHVRDPEIMYSLLDQYSRNYEDVIPLSLLIKRDTASSEPEEWWGDLEKGDYMVTIELPNHLDGSMQAAKGFVDFLLDEEWEVKRNYE